MKLGLFFEWPNPSTGDWKRLFEESIEQIQLAEELGFDFVLIAEHHFSNYGMSPAPLLQALAIAERTKRIRIGTAVLVLPVWQPLRLAEEVAVLDNLTGGRFFCGIGRGYQPHEFARFGVTLEDSRARFNECFDVLLKAWTSDTSFTYEGEYVQIRDEVVVWPKPLQKPHPPLWIAGTSPDTIALAARRDLVPLVSGFAGPKAVNAVLRELLRRRLEAGMPADGWELGAQTFCHVAESNEAAREAMRYPRWQNRAGRALNRRDVVDGRVQARPYEGELDDEAFWNSLYFGDPDRVTRKYLALCEAGATFASCWMMTGGMEHEKLMRSVRLMGKEVLPALHEARPPGGLAEEAAAAAAADLSRVQAATPSD
ncbi:MAG TPA: LLM class flavin-dependent oxidoreductase [Dehalococcoidia bacterium]|nr:LLM class flavin-dependent oxidoreductase [Dehalococcoidia bacterium]